MNETLDAWSARIAAHIKANGFAPRSLPVTREEALQLKLETRHSTAPDGGFYVLGVLVREAR